MHSAAVALAEVDEQTVISFTNRMSHDQAWFNRVRASKPQTFGDHDDDVQALDPTAAGRACDFCRWQTQTAEDTFGRWAGVFHG